MGYGEIKRWIWGKEGGLWGLFSLIWGREGRGGGRGKKTQRILHHTGGSNGLSNAKKRKLPRMRIDEKNQDQSGVGAMFFTFYPIQSLKKPPESCAVAAGTRIRTLKKYTYFT